MAKPRKPAGAGLAAPTKIKARRPRKAAPKPPQDIGTSGVDRRLRVLEHQATAAAVALVLANARISGTREIQALTAFGLADLSALKLFLIERPAPRRAPLDPKLKAFVRESARPVGGAR